MLSVGAMCYEIREAGRPVSSNYVSTLENQNYLKIKIPTLPQKSEGEVQSLGYTTASIW